MDEEKIILYREIKKGVEEEVEQLNKEKEYYEEIEEVVTKKDRQILSRLKPNFDIQPFRIFTPKFKDKFKLKRKQKEFFSKPEWRPCIHVNSKSIFLVPCIEDKNMVYYTADRHYKKLKNPSKTVEINYHDGTQEYGYMFYHDLPRNVLFDLDGNDDKEIIDKKEEFNLAVRDLSVQEADSMMNLSKNQSKMFNKVVLLAFVGGIGFCKLLESMGVF